MFTDPSAAARAAVAGASELVFLCSGNMVRSAFAELYARHHRCPLPVRSGATTYRNDAMFPETAAALRRRGVREEWIRGFRPTHLDELLPTLHEEAVLFGMVRDHLDSLAGWPGLRERAFLLPVVTGSGAEIADPVMDGAEFASTFQHIARCVEALLLWCE